MLQNESEMYCELNKPILRVAKFDLRLRPINPNELLDHTHEGMLQSKNKGQPRR